MSERPLPEQPETTQPSYYFVAKLTHCANTWLAQPPDDAEKQTIEQASQEVREQRKLALDFHSDPVAAKQYSLELFKEADFAPLHLSDELIEQMLAQVGEPPIVEDENDQAFALYLQRAVLSVASSRVRRDLAGQLRRFLPRYTAAQRWKEAVAIDSNAFRTALGHEVSPFLVQMTVQGLARWYEEHEA